MTVTYKAESEITLLEVVRDRLRTALASWCTESTCFVADEPIPEVVSSTNPIVTVVLDETEFDPAMQSGGGPLQTTGNVVVLVTILSQCPLDSPPKADQRILNAQRGILNYRNQVITALLVSDDSCQYYRSLWRPLVHDQSGDTFFLRDYGLYLVRATGPRRVQVGAGGLSRPFLMVGIQFRAVMDVALRTLEEMTQV